MKLKKIGKEKSFGEVVSEYIEVLRFVGKGVSINAKYTNSRNGIHILTKEYRLFEEQLKNSIIHPVKAIKLPYEVDLTFCTYKDIDALIKPVYDTLKKEGFIYDDRFILEAHQHKTVVKKGSEDLIICKIKTLS